MPATGESDYGVGMKIDLKPRQEAYLRSLMTSGAFASLEDALDTLIPSDAGSDDWMKPYVDAALAEVAAGRVTEWTADPLREELRSRFPELTPRAD